MIDKSFDSLVHNASLDLQMFRVHPLKKPRFYDTYFMLFARKIF